MARGCGNFFVSPAIPGQIGLRRRGGGVKGPFPVSWSLRMRSPDGGGNAGGLRPPERRGRPGGPAALTTPPAVANLTELRPPLNLLTTMPQEAPISRDSEILEECQKAIGYRFQQPALLRGALTHASG